MPKTITVTPQEIIHHLKLSCMIPEVTERMVKHKIIAEKAKAVGIKPTPVAVQKMADTIRIAGNLITADDTLKWLKKNCLSTNDFEEIVLSSLLANELAVALFADKVESYFFNNKLNYMGVVMYEIILDDPDLAMELFYSIKEGEIGFHDVAHRYIQEPELRRQGGYKGVLRRKDLKPEIQAAVFAAKPPEIIKPIVTSLGVHLIFVEELVNPQLDDRLSQDICIDLFNEWLNQEINNWEIIIQL